LKTGTDERITLKWILDKQGGMAWAGFIWLRMGTMVGTCE
jgi:hypothetical protein